MEVINLDKSSTAYGYNPNSAHNGGVETRRRIEECRVKIAECLNCKPSEIYFCPSASYANSQAVLGYLRAHPLVKQFGYSSVEHDSIRLINTGDVEKVELHVVKGWVSAKEMISLERGSLISVTASDSELGIIQPRKILSKIAHNHGYVIHRDLTQYFANFNIDLDVLKADMVTIGGHKLGAKVGCAILYVRDGIKLEPLVYGHQENGLIGGTENVEAIESLCNAIVSRDEAASVEHKIALKTRVQELIIDNPLIDMTDINGYLPSILSLTCHSNLTSDRIVDLLSNVGIYVSAGSACNSYSLEPSRTLLSVYGDEYKATHTIRVTLSDETTFDEIEYFVNTLNTILTLNR